NKNENAETTKRFKLEVAIAYFMKKEYDKSIKYYNEIIKNEKDNKAYLYRNVGLSYLKQKKYKEAIQNIDKALELDEQYAEAKHNKAEALEGMKDYEGAFLIYEHIIKDMHDYSYYEEAHKMLKKMKKYEKALEYLQEAEKYYEEDERLYIDKAKLYIKMKNYNQALEEIEKGYKINPKSKEVEKEKEKILKKLGK
ncbi:MAG: tetratricopeptide repeat protein, partial [Leptotrichiaceae bacterium]